MNPLDELKGRLALLLIYTSAGIGNVTAFLGVVLLRICEGSSRLLHGWAWRLMSEDLRSDFRWVHQRATAPPRQVG